MVPIVYPEGKKVEVKAVIPLDEEATKEILNHFFRDAIFSKAVLTIYGTPRSWALFKRNYKNLRTAHHRGRFQAFRRAVVATARGEYIADDNWVVYIRKP